MHTGTPVEAPILPERRGRQRRACRRSAGPLSRKSLLWVESQSREAGGRWGGGWTHWGCGGAEGPDTERGKGRGTEDGGGQVTGGGKGGRWQVPEGRGLLEMRNRREEWTQGGGAVIPNKEKVQDVDA